MKLICCAIFIGLVALCSVESVRAEEDAILEEVGNLLDEGTRAASEAQNAITEEISEEDKKVMAEQLLKLMEQIQQMGVIIAQKQKEAEEEEAKRLQLAEEEAELAELDSDGDNETYGVLSDKDTEGETKEEL